MAAKAAFYFLHSPTMIYQWDGCVKIKSDTLVAHLFESIPSGES
jgi:hypothetical protein